LKKILLQNSILKRYNSGDNIKEHPVGRFIGSVEYLGKQLNWSNEEKVLKARAALSGKAAAWADELEKNSPVSVLIWSKFKSKLLERFRETKSLTERVTELNKLLQKDTEPSENFYDRVSATLYTLEQEVLDSADGELERKAMIR